MKKHKGKYVGAFLKEEQLEKLTAVEEYFNGLLPSDIGRNRSRALSHIIDQFDINNLSVLPKGLPRQEAMTTI